MTALKESDNRASVEVTGSITAVVYQNEDNGYAVLRIAPDNGDELTVVGTIPMCVTGERISVSGYWESHVSHGRQLHAEVVQRIMPSSVAAMEKYLSSGVIKGIGPRLAQRIVRIFGEKTLQIIEESPQRLAEVPGISPAKAQQIGEIYRKQFGIRRLLEYFLSNGLPPELAAPLYQVYGDLAMQALEDDPYVLTESFFGAEFKLVDAYAIRQNIDAEDPRRIQAAAVYNLRHNLSNGHTFLPTVKLCEATASMLTISPEAVSESIGDMNLSERVLTMWLRGRRISYLPEYYRAEQYVARRLGDMVQQRQKTPDRLDSTLRAIQKELGTDYAPAQLEAIEQAARSSVMLLTGGPGTGKTTTVNGILALFDRLHIQTVLTAPTGRAAKRMSELCGREASTIHRLLETQYSSEDGALCFTRDEAEPLDADAVVVDETSMVDIILMEALLRALRPGCRLILVGDPDQLPSVGPGNVFSDLIRAKLIPTVCLTEIFRQAQESLIIMNAHAINAGKEPELGVKNKDFFFLTRRDIARSVDTIVDLCARRLPENMGIPADQIQVLSPTRKNDAGTAALNLRLQEALNPPSPEKREHRYGKIVFREGDRVMQIKNNYDIMWSKTEGFGGGTGVFNGDVGRISEISPESETMTVVYDDKAVEYTFDLLGQLELAYAMTVHKSQGSEYRAVILAVSEASPFLLTRSILYTAVTRARELLILVGNPKVITEMVENDRQYRRYSGLKIRLEYPDENT